MLFRIDSAPYGAYCDVSPYIFPSVFCPSHVVTDLTVVWQSFLSEGMAQYKLTLTFQVILENFYRPAFVVWNNCNVKQGNVSHQEKVLVKKEPATVSFCYMDNCIRFITHTMKCHNWYSDLFPSRIALGRVQQRQGMAVCCDDICANEENVDKLLSVLPAASHCA